RGVPPAAAAGQRRAGRPVHVPHTLHPLRPPQLRPQGDRVLLPPPRPVRARPLRGCPNPQCFNSCHAASGGQASGMIQSTPLELLAMDFGEMDEARRAAELGAKAGWKKGRARKKAKMNDGQGGVVAAADDASVEGATPAPFDSTRTCSIRLGEDHSGLNMFSPPSTDPDAGAQDGAVDERGDRVLRQAHQQVHDRSAPPARGGQAERVPVADAKEQAVEAHQEDEECQAEHQDVQADHGLPRRRHGGPGLLRVGGLLPPVHFQPARAVRAQVSHPEAVEGDLLDLLRQPRAAAERRRVARVGRGDGPAGAPGEGPREAGQEEDHDGPGDTAGHAQPGQRRGYHAAPGEQRQPEQRKLGGEPPEPADRGERLPRRDGVRRGRVGRPGGVVQPLPPPDHGVHAQEQRPVRVRRRLGPELRRHGGERVGQPRREPGGGRAGLEVQAVLRGLHGREAGGDEPGSGRPRAEAGPADEQGRAVHAGRVRGLLRVVQVRIRKFLTWAADSPAASTTWASRRGSSRSTMPPSTTSNGSGQPAVGYTDRRGDTRREPERWTDRRGVVLETRQAEGSRFGDPDHGRIH
ncbi:hypothetical protein THAOC_25332, partial [Thalassiosira oceanica]